MNIIRPEEKALLIWNLKLARTAYISGEELEVLKKWGAGFANPFTDRLVKLGVITNDNKAEIVNAIEISENIKAPYNSFCAPESLHIELTECCPLSCPMCYKSSTKSELPINFLLDVIRQASEMKVFQIALGGGEPLVYPDLLTVVKEISRHKMASTITTSGFGLTNELVKALSQAGLNHIQVSLSGSSDVVHSLSRSGFKYGIEALSILQQFEISYGINWVARMDNIDDFPEMIVLAQAHRVDNINILRYKPSSGEDYANIALSSEKTYLLERIIRNTKGIKIKVDSAFSNLRCKLNEQISFMSGCGAGRRFLAVNACGEYAPCSHVNMKESPTAHAEHLKHAWYHSENLAMFRNLSKNITAPCNDCDYLNGCYGCRAIILAQIGDFNAGDEFCINAKASIGR